MKTRTLACALLLGACSAVDAQWVTGGNSITGVGQYLGCNGTSMQPLRLTTVPNFPIELRTFNVQRARLNGNLTGPMGAGNPFPNVNRDGYLLLSGVPAAFTDPNCRAPFTRLHLVDQEIPGGPNNYAQQQGFRPWQRNGITLTGNNDQGYIGQKYDGTDVTDLVVQWSDNPDNTYGTDRMKFVFTTLYNSAVSRGAASMNGVEAMRLYPPTYNEVHVGIGDFAQAGLAEPDPTERLDLLDRTIRLRDFADPTLYRQDNLTRVLVADATDGRVYWKPETAIVTGSTGADCDWQVASATVSDPSVNHHVYTAVGTDDLCPDKDDLVGIGIIPSNGKLEVHVNRLTDVVPNDAVYVNMETDVDDAVRGINVRMTPANTVAYDQVGITTAVYNSTYRNTGVMATAFIDDASATNSDRNAGVEGSSRVSDGTVLQAFGVIGDAQVSGGTVGRNHALYGKAQSNDVSNGGAYGVKTRASGAQTNCGGMFEAWLPGAPTGTTNYGVIGTATGAESNIGVFGAAPAHGAANNNWAAYFAGEGFLSVLPWQTSDEALKQNIVPMNAGDMATSGADGTDPLNEVQIYSFEYRAEEYPQLGLPAGPQVGVIAQQLAEWFPELVRDVTHPAQYDAQGTEVSPALTFKAVQTGALVPHLVLGYQRNAQRLGSLEELVATQGALLAQLQEQLAACCAAAPTDSDDRMQLENGGLLFGKDRALVIQPNPFSEPPTVLYALERAGRMQLIANSADGKQLSVLREAALDAGDYQLVWDTSALQPGMYYLTLLLDGEPVVKKAVKVGR